NGRFICRFDDTDPSLKKPLVEAYDWYLEDMEWLGCPPDKVVYASEHFDEYYRVAEELIMKRKAYVCRCSAESFRKLKAKGTECKCHEQGQRETKQMWEQMLAGEFAEGQAVLRIKTDMKHKDPAIRDWVAFRVRLGEHPRVGTKYKVWPMLDFESAVQDKMQGTTHIVRGKDLRDSTERQKFLYDYMGWAYPETLYWGRVAVHEFGKLSTSGISEGIAKGKYSGWDDPRLPTLRALRRRGFDPQAVVQFWIDLGLTEKDVRASMETIEAFNKKIIDSRAKRYFFVPKPKKIKVTGIPETQVSLKAYPGDEEGKRSYFFRGEHEFFVPEAPELFRLKDAFNVKKEGKGFVYAGKELLDCPKLQWVTEAMDAELVTSDGIQKGVVERYILDAKKGNVVQLERVGYARIDEISDEKAVFWLTHK
ncbi:glutamate--tRNA ligase, partial [archaeon]